MQNRTVQRHAWWACFYIGVILAVSFLYEPASDENFQAAALGIETIHKSTANR